MGAQATEAKVVTASSASNDLGFTVLIAMDDNPPPAGAFCLASYLPCKYLDSESV